MIYVQIKRFCLTFLAKMARIISGGVMNLYKLNVKKGKLNMNKTEFVEAVAKEAKASKASANELVSSYFSLLIHKTKIPYQNLVGLFSSASPYLTSVSVS